MRRMRKSNARNVLLKTCDKFHNLTGEVVGIVMTWKGSIYVSGPENFSKLVSSQIGAMWSLFRYNHQKAQNPVQFLHVMTKIYRN